MNRDKSIVSLRSFCSSSISCNNNNNLFLSIKRTSPQFMLSTTDNILKLNLKE